jgi:hypothetical protein
MWAWRRTRGRRLLLCGGWKLEFYGYDKLIMMAFAVVADTCTLESDEWHPDENELDDLCCMMHILNRV